METVLSPFFLFGWQDPGYAPVYSRCYKCRDVVECGRMWSTTRSEILTPMMSTLPVSLRLTTQPTSNPERHLLRGIFVCLLFNATLDMRGIYSKPKPQRVLKQSAWVKNTCLRVLKSHSEEWKQFKQLFPKTFLFQFVQKTMHFDRVRPIRLTRTNWLATRLSITKICFNAYITNLLAAWPLL